MKNHCNICVEDKDLEEINRDYKANGGKWYSPLSAGLRLFFIEEFHKSPSPETTQRLDYTVDNVTKFIHRVDSQDHMLGREHIRDAIKEIKRIMGMNINIVEKPQIIDVDDKSMAVKFSYVRKTTKE